jgi:hypothetical protein
MVAANGQIIGLRLRRVAPAVAVDLNYREDASVSRPETSLPEPDRLGLMPPLLAQLAVSAAVVGWLAATTPDRVSAVPAALLLLFAAVARHLIERRLKRGATTEAGGQATIILLAAGAFVFAGLLGQSILTPVIFILPATVWLLSATACGRLLADFGALVVLAAMAGMTLLSLSDAATDNVDHATLVMLGVTALAANGAARWHGARSGLLLRAASAPPSLRDHEAVDTLLAEASEEIARRHDPASIAQAGVQAISAACAPSYVAVVETGAHVVVPIAEDAAPSVEPDLARRLVGLTQRSIGAGQPLWLLADDDHAGDTLILRRMGLDGLLIVPLAHLGQSIGAIQVAWERLPGPVALAETSTFVGELSRRLAPDLAVTRHIEQIERGYFEAISALSATLDDRDQYMRGHSRRVARYAVWVADQLRVEEYRQRLLLHAAELHELGRAGVSEELLTRDGALSENEWEALRRIPVLSAEIVEPLSFFSDVRSISLHMNEHWDGNGGPHGLSGEAIPLLSRILAVADAFDAMTSRRAYREPLAVRTALVQLWNERGSKFDPEIVEVFARHSWADANGRPIYQ